MRTRRLSRLFERSNERLVANEHRNNRNGGVVIPVLIDFGRSNTQLGDLKSDAFILDGELYLVVKLGNPPQPLPHGDDSLYVSAYRVCLGAVVSLRITEIVYPVDVSITVSSSDT